MKLALDQYELPERLAQLSSNKEIVLEDHFMGCSGAAVNNAGYHLFTAAYSGTGASVSATGVAGRAGVVQLNTGTVLSGIAALRGGAMSHSNDQLWELESWFSIPAASALPDLSNSYSLYLGFGNSYAASLALPTKGILLWSNSSTGRLFYRVGTNFNNNTTTTDVDSGVTLSADTWYKLLITIPQVQSPQGSVEARFSLNGGAVTSISTNFPTGASHLLAPNFMLSKTLGIGQRMVNLDYCRVRIKMP